MKFNYSQEQLQATADDIESIVNKFGYFQKILGGSFSFDPFLSDDFCSEIADRLLDKGISTINLSRISLVFLPVDISEDAKSECLIECQLDQLMLSTHTSFNTILEQRFSKKVNIEHFYDSIYENINNEAYKNVYADAYDDILALAYMCATNYDEENDEYDDDFDDYESSKKTKPKPLS